jgi:hypothetical protein
LRGPVAHESVVDSALLRPIFRPPRSRVLYTELYTNEANQKQNLIVLCSDMATLVPVPTTVGELLFQDYLDAMQYPYEFEKEFPGKAKRPDFTVTRDREFLFDVKDFDPCVPEGGGAYDPYIHIREKIVAGRKKFREFKEYPCSVVLRNNGRALVEIERPLTVLGAMYGDAGFRVPIDTTTGEACGEPTDAFLGRGKMLRYGDASNVSNKTISALITLRYVGVGARRIDQLWAERRQTEMDFGKADPLSAYSELCEEAAKRFQNFDPVEKQLGMIVWENAVARIPLSRELFKGPYDERWGFEDNKQRIVYRGEKLAALFTGK